MLSLIIAVVGLVCLAVAVICTAFYIPAVRAAAPAYRELLLSEGEAIQPAREKYWGLDRTQRRLAFWTIGAYAVGLFSTLPLGDEKNALHLVAIIGLTLCIWVLASFATFRKSEWQIRMDVDQEKHEKRMEELRAEGERRRAASGSATS